MTVHVRIVAASKPAEMALRVYVTDELRGMAKRIGGALGVRESRLITCDDPFTVHQRIWVEGTGRSAFEKRFKTFSEGLATLVKRHMESRGVKEDEYTLTVNSEGFEVS